MNSKTSINELSNRHQVILPHEIQHALTSTREQPPKLQPNVIQRRTLKHHVVLIAKGCMTEPTKPLHTGWARASAQVISKAMTTRPEPEKSLYSSTRQMELGWTRRHTVRALKPSNICAQQSPTRRTSSRADVQLLQGGYKSLDKQLPNTGKINIVHVSTSDDNLVTQPDQPFHKAMSPIMYIMLMR